MRQYTCRISKFLTYFIVAPIINDGFERERYPLTSPLVFLLPDTFCPDDGVTARTLLHRHPTSSPGLERVIHPAHATWLLEEVTWPDLQAAPSQEISGEQLRVGVLSGLAIHISQVASEAGTVNPAGPDLLTKSLVTRSRAPDKTSGFDPHRLALRLLTEPRTSAVPPLRVKSTVHPVQEDTLLTIGGHPCLRCVPIPTIGTCYHPRQQSPVFDDLRDGKKSRYIHQNVEGLGALLLAHSTAITLLIIETIRTIGHH
ncbi:hypothetical protein VTN49DRAFT_5158 [Thermomyces lanuginosus]|uniref:uncharacterized protein n=1 Tax=Thermomyces lanuginosus TaxID=5541 RepID=UPI003744785C